ncbi:hypothetical protein ACFLSJ_01330 [Verrucomicrobiota bacterium]
MRSKAPFRLLFNNDTTNTAGVVSPWHKAGEPFREDMLVASIEEVAGCGVDAYLLSPGMGWVPWWQSRVEPDFFEWWRKRTGLDVLGQYERYVVEGGDMVKVLVDACRRHGMAPFVSLRLNDVHHQEHYAEKVQQSLVSCRLYAEHPEWHLDPNHPSRQGYYGGRGMDWAVPDVRQYKLALLGELADNYDLAGFELDFLRHSQFFRDNGPANAERIDIMTEFVSEVRSALDRRRPRRWLCVRIPLELSAHAALGLDICRLYESGVDMFNLSGWFHTTQRTDTARAREILPGAALYLEMTHSAGAHPYFIPRTGYGCDGDPRTSEQQFYTTALIARRRGADGLSLFNFVYYRSGRADGVPVMEPPFHALPRLNDSAFLAAQPQYHMLGSTVYYRQLPRDLAAGKPETFDMDMAAPAELRTTAGEKGRLRIHTEKPLSSAHAFTANINGTRLEPTPDTSAFFDNPFDPMISPAGHQRAWVLPSALIREGVNEVRIALDGGDPAKLIYVDAGVP